MPAPLGAASRFLSRILRHWPKAIGWQLDAAVWAELDEPVRLARVHGVPLTQAWVRRVVEANDNQRFSTGRSGTRIRANLGRSVAVDLGLPLAMPPAVLFHGTASRFLDSIRAPGL